MNRLTSIGPLDVSGVARGQYSAFLAAVGYEQRARFACERLEPRAAIRTAPAFAERQVGAFAENRTWFIQAGFEVPIISEDDAEVWSQSWLARIVDREQGEVRIGIDVSSMSRLRLATILAAIMRVQYRGPLIVDFLYSMAEWSPPSEESEPIVRAGAVTPFFAGWSSEPDLPIVAVVGLGYEPGKAVGAYEYLEATEVWAFLPTSGHPVYTRDINRANESLLRRVPATQKIAYPVNQPFTCFRTLEAVVYGTFERGRPVLLPFGPKVFALCSMLVSCRHRDVPVWRISSGQCGHASDRLASGEIVGLGAIFES